MRLSDSTPTVLAAYLRSDYVQDDEIIELLSRREFVDSFSYRLLLEQDS